MDTNTTRINKALLTGIYGYLTLPVIIFLIGWCKWYIALPSVLVVCASFWLCIREHSCGAEKLSIKANLTKCCSILLIILVWVSLSGIGGYVWQNEDHSFRNAIFNLLVENSWPVTDTITVNGYMQERGLVYYIGFWLPAALIGKLFGVNAGYAAQFVWAVTGIALFYALVCAWRRKIVIWPLLVIIFFSGADAVGTLLNSNSVVRLLGSTHLERWPRHYQFSSMTTQLFWVFNQAIPAWLASAMVFLSEKPKNMIFTWSLIMITSTLPFAGLLPFVLYFMIFRCGWKNNGTVPQLLGSAWKNWGSIQNILGGGIVGFISLFYLMGNVSAGNSSLRSALAPLFQSGMSAWAIVAMAAVLLLFLLAALWGIAALFLRGKGSYVLGASKYALAIVGVCVAGYVLMDSYGSNTLVYKLVFLFTFYMLEAGIYLVCLKDRGINRALFWGTALWLLAIPLIKVGSSLDFCMRASIPALILIMFWLIDALDTRARTPMTWVLIGIFLIGSITSLHEMKSAYINTRDGYVVEAVEKEELLMPGNFSGEIRGIFWEGIAR